MDRRTVQYYDDNAEAVYARHNAAKTVMEGNVPRTVYTRGAGRDEPRIFQIGNDERFAWIWIDLEEEWP